MGYIYMKNRNFFDEMLSSAPNTQNDFINNWTKPAPLQYHILQSPSINYKLSHFKPSSNNNSFSLLSNQTYIEKVKLKSRHKDRAKYNKYEEQVKFLQNFLQNVDGLTDSQVLEYHQKMLIKYLSNFVDEVMQQCSEKGQFLRSVWNSFIKLFQGLMQKLIKQSSKQEKTHLNETIKMHKEYQQKMSDLICKKVKYEQGEKKYQELIHELMKAVGSLNARSKGMNTLYQKAVDNVRQINKRYSQIRSDYIDLMVSQPDGLTYTQAQALIRDKEMLLLARQLQKNEAKVIVKPKTVANGRRARIIHNEINVRELLEELEAEEDFQFEIDYKYKKIINVKHHKAQTDFISLGRLNDTYTQTQHFSDSSQNQRIVQNQFSCQRHISDQFAKTQFASMTSYFKISQQLEYKYQPNLEEIVSNRKNKISIIKFPNLHAQQFALDGQNKISLYVSSPKQLNKMTSDHIYQADYQGQEYQYDNNQIFKNGTGNKKRRVNDSIQGELDEQLKKLNEIELKHRQSKKKSTKLIKGVRSGKIVKSSQIYKAAKDHNSLQCEGLGRTSNQQGASENPQRQKRVSQFLLLSSLKKQLSSKMNHHVMDKEYLMACQAAFVKHYNSNNLNQSILQLSRIEGFKYNGYLNRQIGIENKIYSGKIQMSNRKVFGANKCLKTIADLIKFIHTVMNDSVRSINPANLAMDFLGAIQGKILSVQGKTKKFIQFLRISAPFCVQSFMVRNFLLICGITAHQYHGLRAIKVNKHEGGAQGLAYYVNSSEVEIYIKLLYLANCNTTTDDLLQAYTTSESFINHLEVLKEFYHPHHMIVEQATKAVLQTLVVQGEHKLDIFKCLQLVLEIILSKKAKIVEQLSPLYQLVEHKDHRFTYDLVQLLCNSPSQIFKFIRLLETIYSSQCTPQTFASIALMEGMELDTSAFAKIQQDYKCIIIKKLLSSKQSCPQLMDAMIKGIMDKTLKKSQFLVMIKMMWQKESDRLIENILGKELSFLHSYSSFTRLGRTCASFHNVAFQFE